MKQTATRLLNAFAVVAVVLGCVLPVSAQQGIPPYSVYAEQYNQWSINGQQANTYTFTGGPCWVTPLTSGLTPSFFAFGNVANSVYFPVLIRDANPSNSEIVTPTALSSTQSSCGFSASPANTHITFTVSSGTAGLQEAVYTNAVPGSTSITALSVLLDRNFYNLVSGLPGSQTVGGIIAALKGATNVQVVDTTTAPWTYYNWNGVHYYANGGSNPGTLTLTAGSGTGPTGATITGKGTDAIVSYTTGTSTATGTSFSVTTPAAAAGGFNHSPTCTLYSIGANVPSGTLSCAVTGSGPYVATVSVATTALTASTFYSFHVTLQ